MNTRTNVALGLIGQLKPKSATCNAAEVVELPPPGVQGVMPVIDAPKDLQRPTGFQAFFDDAPLDLYYVPDHACMKLASQPQRETLAAADAGAAAENVYLYCAPAGLAVVVRAWIDGEALDRAMGLTSDQHPVLAQTVGYPKRHGAA